MSRSTGSSVLRGEDPRFLRGSARYTADVSHPLLVDAAHVAFVRSPYAAAAILAIDGRSALSAPGVIAVVTPADLGLLRPGSFSPDLEPEHYQPAMASRHVRFIGEPVAAVVAETPEQAADAVEAVDVEFERQTPVLDLDAALQVNVIEQTRFIVTEDEQPFRESDVTVELRSWNPRQMPAPIEPMAVACGWTADGHLHVWAATQRPHGFRDQLAAMFDIDAGDIHVTAPEVGGGFGGKVSRTAEENVLPAISRLVGRPLRWHGTRSEYFASATQARGERIDLTLAGNKDGSITAVRAMLVKDGGAYPMVGVLLPQGYTRLNANGCYEIPHVEFGSVGVRTNRPPTSAFRGAGRAPYISALERAVDVFASDIGMDPADVRRRNLIRPEKMPYQTPTGATYDEADYPADLERALDAVGYADLRRRQDNRRRSGDTRALGIGIACYNHMTVGGGGEEASVTIETDGTATVVTGSTSQGHGHATTWAQIAADVLALPIESIRVVEGSTDAIDSGVGAVGSRSLQTAGLAIHHSAQEIVDRARQLAAEQLEAAEADIVLGEVGRGFHVVGTPARAVTWAALAGAGLGTHQELSCGEFYENQGRNSFPSGCHVAVVEVDTETGKVELQRLVAADDAGVRVNPMIVEGQLHGGIAAGVAQALGEVVTYDDEGNLLTGSFVDYAIGSSDMFPMFELVESTTASSVNELGFKGVGESGTIGATPAVHNAVVDALGPLGVRHLDLPCTPLRVWEAIQAAIRAGGDESE